MAIYKDEPGITGISLVAYMVVPGDDKLATFRIKEVIVRKRSPRSLVAMKASSANMIGPWDLEVQFYNSHYKQQLFIDQQDGISHI